MKTLLGVDYGKKQIGIALSTGDFPHGLTTIPLKTAVEQIRQLVIKHGVHIIVLGLPEGPLQKKVQVFAKQLENSTDKQVLLRDETLTSHCAQEALIHSDYSRKRRHEKEHQIAAALLLQSYIDEDLSGHT